MSNKSKLLDLADRVEALEGPDRLVGAEVEIALRGFPERAYAQRNSMRPTGSPVLDRMEWVADFFGAGPTASLDSAMSLVPEGWPSLTILRTDDFRCLAQLAGNDAHIMAEDPDEFYVEAESSTPALALTAACLRARAQAEEA